MFRERRNDRLLPQQEKSQLEPKFPFQSTYDDEILSTSIKTKISEEGDIYSSFLLRSPPTITSSAHVRDSSPSDGPGEDRVPSRTDDRTMQTGPGDRPSRDEGVQSARSLSPRKRPRPGLNIVTNLEHSSNRALTDPLMSKPPNSQRPKVVTRAVTATDINTNSDAQTDRVAQTFINLTDLHNLGTDEKKNPDGAPTEKKRGRNPFRLAGRHAQEKTSKRVPAVESTGPFSPFEMRSKGPLKEYRERTDSLSASNMNQEKAVQEISPSDRTIVIGIDNNDIQNHSSHTSNGADRISPQISQRTPATPSILITPADETAPWNYLDDDHDQALLRRPASSIYSQSTSFDKHFTTAADAPPVPPLPSERWKLGDNVQALNIQTGRGSLETWEQDDSPTGRKDNESMSSDNSEKRILEGNLTSVLSARPRSNGWWNLISPILTRSNTLASKRTPITEEAKTKLPRSALSRNLSPRETDWQNETSPDTPRRNGTGSDNVSSWSRWSDWERDRELADTVSSAGLSPQMNHSPRDMTLQAPDQPSPMSPPVVAGLAAEYFLACAHDNISPVPYFDCENHSCRAKLPQLVSMFDSPVSIPDDSARGLEEASDAKPTRSIGVPSEEAEEEAEEEAQEETIAQQAKERHSRSNSASTDIDDESEDEPESVKATQTPRLKPSSSRDLPANDDMLTSSVNNEAPLEPLIEERIQDTRVAPSDRGLLMADDIPNRSVKTEAPLEPLFEERREDTSAAILDTAPSEPRRITVFPPYSSAVVTERQPVSPGPLSPEAERVLEPSNGTAMSEMYPARPAPTFVTNNYYSQLPPRPNAMLMPVSKMAEMESEEPEQMIFFSQEQPESKEKEEVEEKSGKQLKERSWLLKRGCFGHTEPGGKKRIGLIVLVIIALVSVVVTSVVLATTLTRRGDHTPVQSQWVNLTDFPPMPTGISTIAQPDNVQSNSGCVHPGTLWSCALPKDEQATLTSGDPNQPNFRMEIRYRTGIVANSTGTISNSTSKRWLANQRYARNPQQLRARDLFTDDLYTPSPSPPSLAEQSFLGNTTDNITSPFDGEQTPFYITFLSPSPANPNVSKLTRRQDENDTGISNSTITTLESYIPAASVTSNGTASAANLLPYPISQPVRLYNRGLTTEHYGFYTYFDRSIFLSSISVNGSSDDDGLADESGGVSEAEARYRCTWAQTRFLVQIWTSTNSGFSLLSPLTVSDTNTSTNTTNSTISSALQFSRPGSFPYPVSITLDRHGGVLKKKMVYCYDLDDAQRPIKGSGQLVEEFRAYGGVAINPAPGLLDLTGQDEDGSSFNKSAGGIDGGTGGCDCRWDNF